MADTLKSVGSLLVGYAAFAIGGPIAAAVATVLFSAIITPRSSDGGVKGGGGTANTEIGQGIYQVFGNGYREGGDFMRCPKDSDGNRYGIAVRTTKGGGGGSGKPILGGGKGTSEKQFLRGSFGICEGYTVIDKFIEYSDKKGDIVKFDRYNPLASEIKPVKVYGPVTGRLIAELTETIRFYYGSEEQPVDSAESEWYEGKVSADRGLVKVVFNDYGPLEAGTTFKFWLRNTLTGRVAIMTARLKRAGVPESRIDFVSIPSNAQDFGWYVEGIEPARDLAEQVAATSFHDLHFMATERGMVFTDISRANPRFITLSAAELGAFMNNSGMNGTPAIMPENLQSSEVKPRSLKISCKNKDRNFKDDGVTVVWPNATGGEQSVTLRKVDSMNTVYDFAEVVMRELHNASGLIDVPLLPGRCQVAPGCVLIVPDPTVENPARIRALRVVSQKITPNSVILCSCTPFDASVYEDVFAPPIIVEPPPVAKLVGAPQPIFLDGVSVTGDMANAPYLLAGCRVDDSEEWGGAMLEIDGVPDPIQLFDSLTSGLLKTAYTYTDGDLYAFDYTKTLRIQLDKGHSLASTTEDAVLNQSANLLWIDGIYLGFTTVTPVTLNTYDITGLLPGLAGSDNVRSAAINKRCVLITDTTGGQLPSIVAVPVSQSLVKRTLSYSAVATANASKTSSGTVVCTAQNMKVLAVNPGVTLAELPGGDLLVRAYARTRNPQAPLDYWDGGQVLRHSDPFTYTFDLLAATGNSIKLTKTQTFSSARLEFIISNAEKTAAFGSTLPAKLRGRITGANDYGAGFVRAFECNTKDVYN